MIKEPLRSSVVFSSGACCEMQQEHSEVVRGWSDSRTSCNTAKYCCVTVKRRRKSDLIYRQLKQLLIIFSNTSARVWNALTDNYGNVMAVDWKTSHTRSLHLPTLNLTEHEVLHTHTQRRCLRLYVKHTLNT